MTRFYDSLWSTLSMNSITSASFSWILKADILCVLNSISDWNSLSVRDSLITVTAVESSWLFSYRILFTWFLSILMF